MNIIYAWTCGISGMLILYYIGNPFGIYDDFASIGGLILYTAIWFRKKRS